jgi:hypothetical protein
MRQSHVKSSLPVDVVAGERWRVGNSPSNRAKLHRRAKDLKESLLLNSHGVFEIGHSLRRQAETVGKIFQIGALTRRV